jgi:hypothetical protein
MAADRRIIEGYSYDDSHRKILDLDNGMSFATVGAVVLDTMAIAWAEGTDYKSEPRDVAVSLARFLAGATDKDSQGTVILAIPLHSGGADFWQCDSDGAIIEIVRPTAFGAPAEAANVLLDSGVSLSSIFALVSARNFSVSSSFDIVRF